MHFEAVERPKKINYNSDTPSALVTTHPQSILYLLAQLLEGDKLIDHCLDTNDLCDHFTVFYGHSDQPCYWNEYLS